MTATQALAEFSEVPVIDVGPLVSRTSQRVDVAKQLGMACRECGFFYIVGHGIDEQLCTRLEDLSRRFFALDKPTKMRIGMSQGGRAWRGYFFVGDELTSGKPDQKEGIYFGDELSFDHPAVLAGTPLHGRNLFPDIPSFREVVLEYLAAVTNLGHALMAGVALSLELDESYFAHRYTGDPLILFRIFNYPYLREASAGNDVRWGVGEHTDYGLLTILRQDDAGGLQVKSQSRWINAPPIPRSFICNIGDMLDRMTRGIFRSTPHRVLNSGGRDRLSFPFFFDPNFNAEIRPIEELAGHHARDDRHERWDHASVHDFRGTYGDYLLNKVSKVFPQLRREML
ncbi:MAG: isopenicillin N synthase family oxygenase [Planctomycetia bacterium]|nr:isopenicillin N synthase family oxygenase [Planctomycetia bacterium]